MLCYQNQKGWAGKRLLCIVFLAPLCRGISAGVNGRIKENQEMFNLIKIFTLAVQMERNMKIKISLTSASVQRSYLCSRGFQICFSFANASPVTWGCYAC